MRILMVGVDQSTKGGMWTVVENYLKNAEFCKKTNLKYIPTSITGSFIKKISFTFISYIKIFFELSRKKYDVVHIHVSERGSIYRKYIVLLMARLWKCKIIFHMHGAEFEVWYRSCSDKKKKYIRKIVNKADSLLYSLSHFSLFAVQFHKKNPVHIYTILCLHLTYHRCSS